jgi:hypothetical protein
MNWLKSYKYINIRSGLTLIKKELGLKTDEELAVSLNITADLITKMKITNTINFKELLTLSKLLDYEYPNLVLNKFQV